MLKYLALTISLLSFWFTTFSQKWIDSSYAIQSIKDVPYGFATDFAGIERELLLDISYPVGDSIPEDGRPLLIAIHGGGFQAGTKDDPNPKRWRADFAAKGYVSASINYRLGIFNPSQNINCNISWIFNIPWNCYNAVDTAEWYRAYYRGIQDAKGAVRYLVSRAEDFNINPQQIFLVGESAGGFIAMGTGFLDDASEIDSSFYEIDPVLKPNYLYENCSSVAIDSMQLTRNTLGNFEGTLHDSIQDFKIKGVANFYGGIFNNIFNVNPPSAPELLYLFHQPNDKIVPYNYDKILAGYAYCSTFLGCAYIVNRPFIYGSFGIKNLIDTLKAQGTQNLPNYHFENTNNQADCNQQIANSSLGGHQVDSYKQRTQNVAVLFAECINKDNNTVDVPESLETIDVKLYPNPVREHFTVDYPNHMDLKQLLITDYSGKTFYSKDLFEENKQITLPETGLTNGAYLLILKFERQTVIKKIILVN